VLTDAVDLLNLTFARSDSTICLTLNLTNSYISHKFTEEFQTMMHTTLSSKGQVIIPKAMRDNQHWAAGTVFMITDSPEGLFLRAQPLFPPTQHLSVAGSLRGSLGKSAATTDSQIQKTLRNRARENDDATKSTTLKKNSAA
jgi:AbrB family looped-hinge helix DNA binding protein